MLKQPIKQAVVRESELLNTLDLVYRRTDEIASLAEELEDELGDDAFDLADLSAKSESAEAPVVKLLQTLFEDAVQARSSDIHIEPDETVVRIRQRVDGVLQEQVMKEKRVNSALVLRLKLMAGLNISENASPGWPFQHSGQGRSIDVQFPPCRSSMVSLWLCVCWIRARAYSTWTLPACRRCCSRISAA